METQLGELKRVDPRKIWKNEEYDFSAWLSKNLDKLGEEIGIDMQLTTTEAPVGNFSVDILAEEEGTGRKIIIENQLSGTNHDHLGKIITYASGYDASIIIWIFHDIKAPHRRAIDWLNENTNENLSFFAIKLEVWQIDNSSLASKFQVVSSPNEWSKIIKQSSGNNEPTDTKLKQLAFWEGLKAYAMENKSGLRFRTPKPRHWYDVSIGSSAGHISLRINTTNNIVSCSIWIDRNRDLFEYLESQKDSIEKRVGSKLDWEMKNISSEIMEKGEGFDIESQDGYKEYFDWLIDRATVFSKVFGPIIKKYKNEQ